MEHGFSLVVETTVFEGGNEIFDRFAFDADVGRDDVVTHREHARDDDHVAAMKEGW